MQFSGWPMATPKVTPQGSWVSKVSTLILWTSKSRLVKYDSSTQAYGISCLGSKWRIYWIPWATVDLKCLKQVALQVTTSIYGLGLELDSQESPFIFAYTWLPKEIRVGFLQCLKYSLVGKPCWPDLPKVSFPEKKDLWRRKTETTHQMAVNFHKQLSGHQGVRTRTREVSAPPLAGGACQDALGVV